MLNIIETGILSETKLNGKTRQKKMNLWIFATSDDVEGLSLSLRSRFMDLELEEHSYKEFMEIVRRLLKKRYRLEVRIAKLAKSPSDVDWLIQVHKRYGKK